MDFEVKYFEFKFKNFVRLKREEIGLIFMSNENKKNINVHDNYNINFYKYNFNELARIIQNILCEIQKKTSKENFEVNLEIKEKVVSLIYRMEGYYSLQSSFYNLFCGLISSKNKIRFVLFTMILCLMFLIFFSIYVALYYFLINKTLVVNIFLHNHK